MPQEVTVPEQGRSGNAAVEPVLDGDHLRSFTEGDPQLERELATLFLATAEMYLQQMQEAFAGGRPWTSIAHALKGASANFGAHRLSALALQAERSEPDRAPSSKRSGTRSKTCAPCSRSGLAAEPGRDAAKPARSRQNPLDLRVHFA
jgi:Hpt domain